tara:strand:+ start:2789 stop:3190 length:402 start_codon:yes stop_codon:yes gene_type:complete
MTTPETLKIDEVEYVRKDVQQTEITYDGKETIASLMIGKFVIVRSRNEGINAGTVELADMSGVMLRNCRRIHYMAPKDKSTSWYEGVSTSGLSDDSRLSSTVARKVILEDYSMTECNPEAQASIMEKTPNAQS